MPKIHELYRISFPPKKISSNAINGKEYPNLPKKDFELLSFWRVISANEFTIRDCNSKSKKGSRGSFQTIE